MDRPLPNDLRCPYLGILLPKAVHTREHRTRYGKNGYLRSRIRRQSMVLHLLWDSRCDVADDGVLAYGCDVE